MARQVPISFKDLAVRFSEEEWRLLQEGQREFYRDVMRENYETLVSVGTDELLPLSAFLSPMEPGGATAGESHAVQEQGPPSGRSPQGRQPQHSLHLSALVQLVKEIPEFLFRDVRGAEDCPESGGSSLEGEPGSSAAAVALETCPPQSLPTCLPESPASRPSLATTPTGSSSSSGPAGDRPHWSPLPVLGAADKPQPSRKENPGAPGKDPSPPTGSLDPGKSHQIQERETIDSGTPAGSSPLQGLVNCLKDILVPAPQHSEAAPNLLPSLPGLSALRQTRAEAGLRVPPWPVKTEAVSGACPLQGLLNCLKEIPEAPDKRPSPSGAGNPRLQEDPGAWKKNAGDPGTGSVLAMVKVEESWAQTPPVPAAYQLGRQGHSPSTGDTRGVRVPRWGPITQASRTSSSPLEALEACLKGIPSAGPSPLQPLATSWSRSPQPGDAGSQRPELQPQGSHSEEATREPLLPLGLQGCMREGPPRPLGPQVTPASFSSASSSDGDLDFWSPVGNQGQRPGKGYLSGSSPLQGLENCLREIPVPRPQAAWTCSDRGLRRVEPRIWTADRQGQRGEACEPARLGQNGGDGLPRSLRLASPQAFTSSCVPTCHQGPPRPGSWRWLQDGPGTVVSPLHRLESSLRGILPVKPLRFACVAGLDPGPSPSPCSSSLSSSDGEDPRPEPKHWQPPLQERDHLPSCKDRGPLSPISGASPRDSSSSCPAEDSKRTEPRDCSGLSAGKTEEGSADRPQSPKREEGTEQACESSPLGKAGGEERADEGGGGAAPEHSQPAPQLEELEEKPEPKGCEEPRVPERGPQQPHAAGRPQGKLHSGDPPETPSKSPPAAAVLPTWPPTSLQPPCPCGRPLQQELCSLGTALTEKLDQLAVAVAGLAQQVATMRTQMDRLVRRPRNLGPKGQASWQWPPLRGPRWASRPSHRHLPYWKQKGPSRPRPKILRAPAESCRAGDRPGLCRGKDPLRPPPSPDASVLQQSGPSQQSSPAPSCHPVNVLPVLDHPGYHQSPHPPSVPAALVPLVASPVASADVGPLAAGVAATSVPDQPKEPNSLLGGTLRDDLWGGDHRDPRWGAH